MLPPKSKNRLARGGLALTWKRQYDFSKGKWGTVIPLPPEKVHITIHLDRDAVERSHCAVPEIRKL
jgi:hypothetical protein